MRISRVVALTLLSVVAAVFIACSSPAASPGDETPVAGDDPELVEVTAPIESVEINIAESSPPQYFLIIQAGLSNGCIKQGSYDWKLEGNTVTVDVTVLAPAQGSLIACTDDYRVVEKSIALGSDFEPGTTYTVNVNDETTSFTTENTVAQKPVLVEAPAPIDGLTINIAESFPPQYMLLVESGLPNGCATFGTYDVKRDGDTISVSVTNYVPAEQTIACDMSYGTVETTVDLGSDFEPGTEYVVLVNDKSTMFTAQGEAAQKVEQDAPVDSVGIEYAPDGGSQLVLMTGLPSGCHELGEPLVLRADDTIIVEVQNLVELGAICTDDYRVVESRLPIPGDLEACATYDINVNGVVHTAQAIGPSLRCSAPETPSVDDEMKTVEVDAPIDGFVINVAESFPLQYFVAVTSGLPSGCAKFGGYSVDRDGTTIRVTVTNLMPADKEIACTAIYGIVETSVPLGSAFNPDTTYTVIVNNDAKASFTTDSSAPGESSKAIEVKIDMGDTVDAGPEELRIGFLDVTEDSRCPANVVCVWAGRASILLGVVAGDSMPAFHEVEFGGGAEGDGKVTAGGYSIEVVALNPYPGTVTLGEGERPAYVLIVQVTKD